MNMKINPSKQTASRPGVARAIFQAVMAPNSAHFSQKNTHAVTCQITRGWLCFAVTGMTALGWGVANPAFGGETVGSDETNSLACPFIKEVGDATDDWLQRVSATQAEQPGWVTPLVTVTPRLEQELRYDQYQEALPGGKNLYSYGGGKGVELIPARQVEVIIGLPAWQTVNTQPRKSGWTDENFLLKYRLLSADKDHGDYILTAFMGLSVPSGSDVFSTHHFGFTPTLAGGKGWGRFDFQSTLGIAIPDNGAAAGGPGTPILFNTALQYHVGRYFWPEMEFNETYWPNSARRGRSQLMVTPGFILGRFPMWHRVGVTVGLGYQVAVTDQPLVRNNLVLSARIPF